MLGKGSKFQDTVTQPQLTPRPTPRGAFLCNFTRTSRGEPAHDLETTTSQSAILSLRMPCKRTMKDSYSESRLERPIVQPLVHLHSASKCLAWSTLTAQVVTIDGSAPASALVGRAGSGVVSGGCSKCEWCMRAPSQDGAPPWTATCASTQTRCCTEMRSQSCFLASLPAARSTYRPPISSSIGKIDGVNTEHRAAEYFARGASKGLHGTCPTPRDNS